MATPKQAEAVQLPPRIAPPGRKQTSGDRPNLSGYIGAHVVLVEASASIDTRTTKKGEEVESARSTVTIFDGSKNETVGNLDSLRLARQILSLKDAGMLPTVVLVVKHGRGVSTAFAPWDDEAATAAIWSAYLAAQE